MKHLIRSLALAAILFTSLLHAQVPQLLNYQGRVAVGNPAVNFDGSGQFRFALVNAAGNTTYWSNDGKILASDRLHSCPFLASQLRERFRRFA